MIKRKVLLASMQKVPEKGTESRAAIAWSKRRRLERVVLSVVLLVSLIFIIWGVVVEVGHIKRIILRQQLMSLRNAVIMYHVMYKKLPPDLKTLARLKVVDARGRVPFKILTDIKMSSEGELVDPFGLPYKYDSAAGRVESQSPCCKYW